MVVKKARQQSRALAVDYGGPLCISTYERSVDDDCASFIAQFIAIKDINVGDGKLLRIWSYPVSFSNIGDVDAALGSGVIRSAMHRASL